ncbi:MAG: 30S ribosomal protein S8 [Dehalococcoidia bacterium]|nr:30S ribosomal protein S8 [Chloroflexota bacterium]MDP6056294.1 30S ribosomal protein S8 [Dehalococcoidia bacterium]MDP7090318.1 30S ribosomal protein S8 [Dehalococcoidia bacterium]MDP7261027.1 30S ribosomal protein S8 [Dehalococcoidia bacterium]MDP7485134.1 30S ribosomal protein S8 [Dehalococcoidia bacterium]
MPVTDPIADMLTRIRNAVQVRHESLEVPASRMKSSLLKLMSDEGFISSFAANEDESTEKKLEIHLRYYEDKTPVIQGLKRVSKPGLRVYVGKNEVPRYFGGLGVAFMSTSKGVMTGQQARRQGVGGELLFYIW